MAYLFNIAKQFQFLYKTKKNSAPGRPHVGPMNLAIWEIGLWVRIKEQVMLHECGILFDHDIVLDLGTDVDLIIGDKVPECVTIDCVSYGWRKK